MPTDPPNFDPRRSCELAKLFLRRAVADLSTIPCDDERTRVLVNDAIHAASESARKLDLRHAELIVCEDEAPPP